MEDGVINETTDFVDLRLCKLALSKARLESEGQTENAAATGKNQDQCVCWARIDNIMATSPDNRPVLVKAIREASPHRTTRAQLGRMRRSDNLPPPLALTERDASRVMGGYEPPTDSRISPKKTSRRGEAWTPNPTTESRGDDLSATPTRRLMHARSPSPNSRLHFTERSSPARLRSHERVRPGHIEPVQDGSDKREDSSSRHQNTSSTTSRSRRRNIVSTEFIPEPIINGSTMKEEKKKNLTGNVPKSLMRLGEKGSSSSGDCSYFSQLSRKREGGQSIIPSRISLKRLPSDFLSNLSPGEESCSDQLAHKRSISSSSKAYTCRTKGSALSQPEQRIAVPEGREDDLSMDFYWLPSPPAPASARHPKMPESYRTMKQDPVALAILQRFMQRSSSVASSQLDVSSVDLTKGEMARISHKPPSQLDSRRLLAITARFAQRVTVSALVRSVRGMKLMGGFGLTIAREDEDTLLLTCGPKRKTYMLRDLKIIDYSLRAVEMARNSVLISKKLTETDWPEDLSVPNPRGEIVVCYFTGHSIPVILVFENVSDRQDFVELLTNLLSTRGLNAQFIWQDAAG